VLTGAFAVRGEGRTAVLRLGTRHGYYSARLAWRGVRNRAFAGRQAARHACLLAFWRRTMRQHPPGRWRGSLVAACLHWRQLNITNAAALLPSPTIRAFCYAV